MHVWDLVAIKIYEIRLIMKNLKLAPDDMVEDAIS